ncbi:fructose-bisphosphate aldolase [Penicillium atrosanguineum]|uniref:fructose-bisphosphate aldolase n=1 Tax=Penicillium atrosanguineum TaxID=1132637 RepID=UPI0023A621DC|nr:fructose-bisphosphate aldolase [Penicillium atrosanguineum]KAJ5297278.1 fructose-bisphosphate aldolase [Penicillium atrosanguineum]
MATEKPQESHYWLKPDEEERARLNNQHRVLIQIIENEVLHAPIDPSTIVRVADVGTGTGIWLDALAAHLDPIPTASGQPRQYDGLDISPAHFPASHPENFHYDVYNILQPVPEELKEKYDLVHVRLLVAALSKGDMNTAVDNLAQLLRPGGWIQWDELDGDSWAGRVPSSHVSEMNELVRKHMGTKGMELHVPAAFVEAAEAHPHLQSVSERIFNTIKGGSELKDAVNLVFLWSCTRSTKMILQASGTPRAEEEFERLAEGAKADIERDEIFWDSDEHVLLAQKK